MAKAIKASGLSSAELDARALQLEADICALNAKLQELRTQRTSVANRLNEARQAAAVARKQERAQPKPPGVSAHAVLRYLERRMGFDVAAIEREILTPGTVAAIRAGATTLKHDGCEFVIKDGTIVTVLA